MGFFDYDGPLIKMLVKAANMMIVSFFWLLMCIPVVTVIPATAALFHTTTKVIRQSGNGVVRDFFSSFKGSLKKGIPLSLICLLFGFLLYTSLSFGSHMWKNGLFWTVYYAIGFILAFAFATMLLFIPPTLSRFECSIGATLRLSLYFASKNLLRSLWNLILLGFVSMLVYFYPVTILIIPGLYFDLICGGMEKTLLKFMQEQGLVESKDTEEQQNISDEPDHTDPASDGVSSLDLSKLLDEPNEDPTDTGDKDE